jgi:hypothetical protein
MNQTQARHTAELVAPGFLIGLVAGAIGGGVAAMGGLPVGYVLGTTVGLGVPLAAFGVGYSLLLASGRIRLGGVAPAAVYWLFAFPVARLIHEVLIDVLSGRAVALPDGPVKFIAYQALVSVGFAIGFIWMHEYVFGRWWIHIRGHNPVADRYVEQYTRQAARTQTKPQNHPGGTGRRPA